jgi:aspartyl protease family protein
MNDVPRGLKHLTVWLLVGTALFLAVQAWQDRARRSHFSAEGGVIELRRGADGHFHWPGQVNGIEVDFLVDTGATRTALPLALAERAQLQAEARAESSTAGGVVQGHVARADIRLDGGVQVARLPVVVLPDLQRPLLGMDILSRLRFTQSGDVLRLEAAGR